VVSLFAAGASIGRITDEVSGTRDRKGGTWKAARARVEGVIRSYVVVEREDDDR
jgi:hypothetical protein